MTATETDISVLAASHDIISLGMRADDLRRRLHDNRTTFLRVADASAEPGSPVDIPDAAGEIRIVGTPGSMADARARVAEVVAASRGTPVSAFALSDLEQLSVHERVTLRALLESLSAAGLELVAEAPFERLQDPRRSIEEVNIAGLALARLTLGRLPELDTVTLLRQVAALQLAVGVIRSFAPLPRHVNPAMPSTGFDDVKRVALSRLIVDTIPSIQVDWALYGPKLAQVALTVGADDVDGVSAKDESGEGRRRAPLEGDPTQHPGGRVRADRAERALRADAAMNRVRLGAVEYLNARPLVFRLDRSLRFVLRLDWPSRCAELLHDHVIDVGLIPSIEYLRAPASAVGRQAYRIVPGLAVASCGPVASVAIYTKKAMTDVRSIALDTSSRTSVALTRILGARVFRIQPDLRPFEPDLETMLADCDAALIIGDKALLTSGGPLRLGDRDVPVEKIDLGEVWTRETGLPFVYAFWAGRSGALHDADIEALRHARDQAAIEPETVASEYFTGAPEHWALGARYLQDNIRYQFGPDEKAGLELFYRYAAEARVIQAAETLRFF